ncbi:hypothetical protein L841_1373 [Mycobacterium sp. MAC_080597_8934]|nr:hypothetical protein L840_4315 [Mycobacterium sp. MAC_011194_8550]ETZ69170.1 hypothetical protein L841_1373 [Mycobacterium sp. MAC_080597_8934]
MSSPRPWCLRFILAARDEAAGQREEMARLLGSGHLMSAAMRKRMNFTAG